MITKIVFCIAVIGAGTLVSLSGAKVGEIAT